MSHIHVSKAIPLLRYFPVYFILNPIFSNYPLEVIPYPIFLKFSPLKAEVILIFFFLFHYFHVIFSNFYLQAFMIF